MRKQLQDIVAHFGLGALESYEQAGGYTNANYFVRTTSGRYVVKIASADGDMEDRRNVHDYLARLADFGFPLARYAVPADGDPFFVRDGVVATVQYDQRAKSPKSLTPGMAVQVGHELARLHRIPLGNLQARRNWLHPETVLGTVIGVGERCPDAEGADVLLAAIEPLIEKDWGRLPLAILHADLYADNTLFHGEKLVCFIDWEEVGLGAAVLDFGTAVIGCCFPDDQFDPVLYDALRRSYEEVRPFSGAERAAITDAVRYAAVICALWRLSQRDRLGDRYKLYWKQGLDRWEAP